jgi:hypothetical protein
MATKKKKSKKEEVVETKKVKKTKIVVKATPSRTNTAPIGTADVAEKLGTTPKNLRNFLRTHFAELRDGEYTTWGWAKWTDPNLVKIMKAYNNREIAPAVGSQKASKKDEKSGKVQSSKAKKSKTVEEEVPKKKKKKVKK